VASSFPLEEGQKEQSGLREQENRSELEEKWITTMAQALYFVFIKVWSCEVAAVLSSLDKVDGSGKKT
jgi:hypothetical protein